MPALLLIDNVNTANPVAETENRYNKTVVVTIAFFRATGMIVVERFDLVDWKRGKVALPVPVPDTVLCDSFLLLLLFPIAADLDSSLYKLRLTHRYVYDVFVIGSVFDDDSR